jgi:proteasome lid subunit RPN8/RPN11
VDYKGTGVSLVMQTSVWNQARLNSNSMEFIVGWYHSHPNLGAFFSGTDKRTQQSFFYHDYSVGWVIDWVRGENSWFLGKKSQPVQLSHVIISLDVMR